MNTITRDAAVILIAAAATLAPATGAMAAPTDATPITVTGNLTGHTLKAYRLGTFSNVSVNDSNSASATVSAASGDMNTKVTDAAKAAGLTVNDGQDGVSVLASTTDAAKLRTVADSLATSLASATPDATADGTAQGATLNTKEGWYLITDSKGMAIIAGTVIKSGDKTATTFGSTTLGTVAAKTTDISLDKKVNGKDADSVSTGSTVTYTVTASLPAKTVAKDYQLTDTLTGGVYDKTSLTATIDGKAVTVSPQLNQEGNQVTVDLTGLLGDTAKTIVITYRAVTTAAATTNAAATSGHYSNGAALPAGQDTIRITTHGFDITKVSSANADVKLPGAKFRIKSGDQWLKYDNASGKWAATDWNGSTEFSTDNQGALAFGNLGAGTYTVQETAAPAGYVLGSNPSFTAVIGQDGSVKFSGSATGVDQDSATVKNTPTLGELAHTGVDLGHGLAAAGGFAGLMCALALVAVKAGRRGHQAE